MSPCRCTALLLSAAIGSACSVGTPFCVTVDGTTLEDGTVTVRHRDTMEQHRLVAFAPAHDNDMTGGAGRLTAEPAALLHLLRTAMMSGA